jgi:hypothetical protein
MENMWRDEGRKGHPRNNATPIKKEEPPMGFEGMNFEQKRRPYREDDRDSREKGEEMNGGRNRDL